MKRQLFSLILFLFLSCQISNAEDCFTPALFHTSNNRLELPCVVVNDTCYWAELKFDAQSGFLEIQDVDISHVDFSQVTPEMQSKLPTFSPSTNILYLPIILVDDTPFEAYLRLESQNGRLGFVVQILSRKYNNTTPQVCWPGVSTSPVFSWLLRDSEGNPIICHEFRGHPLYVEMAASMAPAENITGFAQWIGDYVPCPSGFEWGCYYQDEDQNEATYYRYNHPLAEYIGIQHCPVEDGYQIIR